MKATFLLSRRMVPAESPSDINLLLKLSAPVHRKAWERKPVNLSVVIDRSGSMGGEKLRYCLEAVCHLVRQLGERDRISVVSFDEHVDTVIPPTVVVDKEGLCSLIASLRERGTTNLSGGWLRGCRHIQSFVDRYDINRVLILTDGQANEGITDFEELVRIARLKRRERITLTTIGLGDGFNEDLLMAMAESGGGNFYFIESPHDVVHVFANELRGLLSIIAQNLLVRITPARGAELRGVLNDYPSRRVKRALEVSLGDLYGAEERGLLVQLRVKPGGRVGRLKIGTLAIEHDYLGDCVEHRTTKIDMEILSCPSSQVGKEREDEEVERMMALMAGAQARDRSVQLADAGDVIGASNLLERAVAFLAASSAALNVEVQRERDDLAELSMRLRNQGYGTSDRKYLRSTSRAIHRTQLHYGTILNRVARRRRGESDL